EPLRPELVCRYKLTSNGWPYYIYYPIYEPYRVVYGTGNGAGNESPVPLCEVTCDSADTISAVPCSDITPVNKGDTEFLNYMERTWQQQR
ncbi:MAG: hypothetical protein SVY53_03225, partial [Chloroflexota bacterium]|nr:hypothetical protein [Chloroflexota bacterium]